MTIALVDRPFERAVFRRQTIPRRDRNLEKFVAGEKNDHLQIRIEKFRETRVGAFGSDRLDEHGYIRYECLTGSHVEMTDGELAG